MSSAEVSLLSPVCKELVPSGFGAADVWVVCLAAEEVSHQGPWALRQGWCYAAVIYLCEVGRFRMRGAVVCMYNVVKFFGSKPFVHSDLLLTWPCSALGPPGAKAKGIRLTCRQVELFNGWEW